MKTVLKTCESCQKPFDAEEKEVRRGRARFCSRPCLYTWQTGKPPEGFTRPESTKAERVRANGLINSRIQAERIAKPEFCMKCGKAKRLDGHHLDYTKPEEVFWLCRSCHMKVHFNVAVLDGLTPMVMSVPQRDN